MPAHRLIVLPAGFCRLSASRIRRGGSDEETTIPMPIFAIDTDAGWVLFDTGCDPAVATHPEETWGKLASVFRVEIRPEDGQVARLASIGLTPADISHVVVSHLHMDHAGGIRLFPQSRVWVQKAELRWALYPDRLAAAGYVRSDFDHPDVNYELIEGDAQVVDGVHVMLTDGHTPGHQSLVVDLPSGRYVLTGDCAYELAQVTRGIPPPVCSDDVAATRSLARIRALQARDGATIIVNHDMTAWPSVRLGPGAEYA